MKSKQIVETLNFYKHHFPDDQDGQYTFYWKAEYIDTELRSIVLHSLLTESKDLRELTNDICVQSYLVSDAAIIANRLLNKLENTKIKGDSYMPRYTRQDIECSHCNGSGRIFIDWDKYVYWRLPDKIREALDRLNSERVAILKLNDIAARIQGFSMEKMDHTMLHRYQPTLSELYQIADALECKLEDLLPIY